MRTLYKKVVNTTLQSDVVCVLGGVGIMLAIFFVGLYTVGQLSGNI